LTRRRGGPAFGPSAGRFGRLLRTPYSNPVVQLAKATPGAADGSADGRWQRGPNHPRPRRPATTLVSVVGDSEIRF